MEPRPRVPPQATSTKDSEGHTGVPASPSPAAPSPPGAPVAPASDTGKRPSAGMDPTRYGDWEKNGRCIDF
ncbi:MAG: DUF1674 domain-containing protein [Rhodospirillales bacterium]|nr:DUF1674 domain-containing protein [Rhodospirillales bacterium]